MTLGPGKVISRKINKGESRDKDEYELTWGTTEQRTQLLEA
jgi:hypothetical protein